MIERSRPPQYVVYVVIDEDDALRAVRNTRQDARRARQDLIDDPLGTFDILRVRRAKLTLFES